MHLEVEILDSCPQWKPAFGEVFLVGNINGGDSIPVALDPNGYAIPDPEGGTYIAIRFALST